MTFEHYQYTRPDLAELEANYAKGTAMINEATTPQAALEGVRFIQKIQGDVETQVTLASVRYSIDTKDEFYKTESEFWDETLPIIGNWETDYYKAVLASAHLESLKEELPDTFFKLIANAIKTFDAKIIPLMQKENKLTTEYDTLVASAEIDYKGKAYNLSGLVPFMQSTDRQERKETNELYSAFFAKNLEAFDRIYDELVQVRHQMAVELGYKDYVEMGYDRMNRLDYNRQDVEVYRKEVLEHIVPLANYIYERQAKRIGLADDFKYYDVAFEYPSGNAKPIGSSDEIIAKAGQMYKELSTETDEFFRFMQDEGLLDLLTKPGKQSGGYCTYIPNHRAPFIFANFNGTSGDVDVLTHEAGHAFQVYQSRWIDTPEAIWPTYESCEIHSMSMEFIAWPWMDQFFGDQVEQYKYSHLASAITFLPYGVLVDHFQHEVYSNPTMTPAERRHKWRELESLYNPWKDYADNDHYNNGGFWFKQGHIFASPFYYIDYTLAQVCAIQFWQRSQVDKDEAYWQDYLNICKAGGTLSFKQIVDLAQLKSPFEPGSLTDVQEAVRAYLESVPEDTLQ